MQYFQFLETLRRKSLSRVYLFYGEEDFLKEEALKRLEEILFSEKGVPLKGWLRLEGKDVFEDKVSASVLNERLKTMPLLGGQQLIVIKKTKKLNEECRRMLIEYIKKPSSSNFLVVFLDKDEDKKKWGPFFVEFKRFYEGDILAWLISRAGDKKRILSRDTAKIFLERLGTDLALLSQGLERVIDYIGFKKVIEAKDIEEILGDEKNDRVFDLTNAMASQDLPACLNILNKLFLALTPPQEILALLSWQIRRLYTLKRGGELKMPSFFLRRLEQEANRFREEQLEECLYGLRTADREIKEGCRSPKLSLELFFFNFLKPEESKI